jgi:tetratricopeptide (TPR) repeat protein
VCLNTANPGLTINPNAPAALALTGWIETMRGNQPVGREMIARARRLNPQDPRGWLLSGALAISAVIEGNYLDAVAWARKALVQNRRFTVALRVLAVALVELGQRDEAAEAVQRLRVIEPELTISEFFRRIPVPLERMARTYAEALRAAGLPE